MLSGAPMRMLYMLGAGGVGLLVLAYLFYPVATQRIDGFLFAAGRPISGRIGAADADRRRPVRRRAGRRHPQILAARAAHRLHLLGDRRGVRDHRLPRHRHPLHDDRRARAGPPAQRGGQVPRPRHRRPGHPVRAAGADQHGGQRPYRAVQGHDPAVHLLWRLVDDRAGDGLRPAARLQPPQPASARLALCGEMERARNDVAPLCPRRGRDRRPYGAGPCARRGIAAARAPRRPDHRRSRRAHSRPVRQCPGPCPARRAAGRRAGRLAAGGAEHHDRPGDGAPALRDLPALGGDRLRRLSGLPGPARRAARPHPDPAPRAECGARPGQPADGRPGRRDRHRL